MDDDEHSEHINELVADFMTENADVVIAMMMKISEDKLRRSAALDELGKMDGELMEKGGE